ncbi:phytanoyl-CoA dioxygenase family protein [Pseudomonas aeruginosa]|uniref:phytanoyl-CoA dioxygenase family protein n=1 Tax=Pseudomonas aeruginosa TaxID=287 RepID=UPI000F843F7D|nr:phytanoyl-CoA dioxygenase family protein [Pseudomonas aeruginosa]RTR46191.1 phytanoyl-CoA dioxygenase family protein [Pseudomonas aeruginosa]
MKHYRQVVSPQLRQQALDWILAAAQRPDPALEPEFDIADDERREAKKVRNLHRHDPLFWDDWFARSGLDALVRDHLRKPRLLRHAAFIKRHADESYIPLHQDIALWEKRYESAQTFWVALTPSRNDNGGMFYYPDDRTIFPHEFDLAYPMFKCIDLQANGISREQLVDAELDAGDVLLWPARTAHGSHNNRSGQLRIGMPIVFVDDDEFHQLNREDSMKTWIASNLKSVFPDEAITEDNLDHYLPQLCDYSLKMVTFLARFSRQFGHAPKIHDFIREPRLATLSASDAGARR